MGRSSPTASARDPKLWRRSCRRTLLSPALSRTTPQGAAAVRSRATDPASGTSRAPPDSAGVPVIDERSGCWVLEPATGGKRCSETSDQQCRGGSIRRTSPGAIKANMEWLHIGGH